MRSSSNIASLPLRECGLKYALDGYYLFEPAVTPLAGVWIEMIKEECIREGLSVTPLAGVWIEILHHFVRITFVSSHSPCGSVD